MKIAGFSVSDYIVPVLLLLLLITAHFKRINTYDTFVKGAGKAVGLAWSVFPFIVSILVMVQLLRVSGIAEWTAKLISPAFSAVGIPPELVELLLIRPFTNSGSLAILDNIFTVYGADSYIARCASAIMSCSETIFYVTAVYFSATKVRKLRYCIPVALFVSILGAVIACLLCRVM